jgi:formyl-CoA transferase
LADEFKGRSAVLDATAAGALQGKVVIDLTRVLGGPYCTQILADHGAEVVKIEPPRGDETREWGPPFHDGDAPYFLGVNRNKRAMALDLSKAEGQAVLLRLLERADILVENFKPGTMEDWGLGFEAVLKARFPKLIHCRVSGFGSDGPWGGFPGYDAIVQAMAGWFSVNGEKSGEPVRLGLAMVDMGTGLYCAVAILLALAERERSGLGQYLDMTLYDCAVALMHPQIPNYLYSGEVPGPTGNAHPNISPYDTFRTKTVDIFIGAGNDRAFAKLCREIGREELIEDERFSSNSARVSSREALKVEIESALMRIEGEALADRLARAGLASGPIHDTAQVVAHAHTQHRKMVLEKDGYKAPASPIKLSRTPAALRSLPPKFSEHSEALLSEFGFTVDEINKLFVEGTVPQERQK